MNINKTYLKTIPLLLIPSLFTNLFPGKVTIIICLCYYPLFFVYWRYFLNTKLVDVRGKWVINLLFLYNIIIGLRAILNITDFDDFKNFIGQTIFWYFFFPLLPYILNKDAFVIFIKRYIKYGIPACFFIFIILLFNEKAGDANIDLPHMMSGLTFLVFFAPYLKGRYRSALLCLVVLSLFSDLSVRSNIANVGVAIAVYLLQLIFVKSNNMLRLIAKLSFICITSFVALFSYLGTIGTFNIFNIGDMVSVSYEVGGTMKGDREILADSRTVIYEDVWNGLELKNAYLWGLGGDGRVDTYLVNSNMGGSEYMKGRQWQESGMLNYVQWGGIIGGVIYALFFVGSAYLAIWRSKNSYMICLGIFIIYKLLFSFIEDPQSCSISYFLLIVFVSLGYQKWTLNATDQDIKHMAIEMKHFK